jgi:site-specific DNA recombinase
MRAATYLRSSKDRHDVSIDAQRRELAGLAKNRSQRIVEEFADAVESGKDEDREGFQQLISAVRNPRRGWDTLLVLDTSRIARRRHLAMMFERECERAGITLVYKSMPDTDPITGMLLKSLLQAMDEWHSLTSKAKGLAGMRENVRQGFRAGGRAPMGYKLEAVATGAMREGQQVSKSRLVLGDQAGAVREYLVARAMGTPRGRAGLPEISPASLVGVEWNALTYAGHTVWNVHAENGSGRKRRPRAEWVIQRDTHEALIDDAQAEAILAKLEAYAPTRTRQRESGYLLAGLLVTPDGRIFHGDRGSYRVKGRQVKADQVDEAVAAQVLKDIQSSAFVRAVTAAARATKEPASTASLRASLTAVESRLAKLVALIEQTDSPAPLLRQMETVEGERARLSNSLATAEHEAAERAALSRISEHEVRRMLIDHAAQIEEAAPEPMRAAFADLLTKVELDGDVLRAHYRIGRPGKAAQNLRDKVASPRGFEPRCPP